MVQDHKVLMVQDHMNHKSRPKADKKLSILWEESFRLMACVVKK